MSKPIRLILFLMFLTAAAGWLFTLQSPAAAQEPERLPTLPVAAGALLVEGTVSNGTPDGAPPIGAPVILEIYREFNLAESRSGTVAEDGSFRFVLEAPVEGDAYLVRIDHAATVFSSNIARPTAAGGTLDLPITVYEPTTATGAITIEQLHITAQRRADRLAVTERYTFTNAAAAVFVGPSGDPAGGTLQFLLPAGAADVAFARGLGFDDTYTPAPEVVAAGSGWQDTRPLPPGSSSATLRVSYTLPLATPVTQLDRSLPYPVRSITVALADPGLNLTGEGWQPVPDSPATFAATTPGAALSVRLEPVAAAGNRTTWITLGGVLLLVAASATLYFSQRRRLSAPRSAGIPVTGNDS